MTIEPHRSRSGVRAVLRGMVAIAAVAATCAPAFAQGSLTAELAIAPATIRSGGPAQIEVALGNTADDATIGGIAFDVVFPPVMHRWGTPSLNPCGGVVTETATGFRFRNGSLGASASCVVTFPITVEQDGDGDVALTLGAVSSIDGGTVEGLTASVRVIGGIAPTITSPPPPARGYLGLVYRHVVTVTGSAPVAVEASGLPPGLAYDDATRTLSGKPTQAGEFLMTLRAVNHVAFGTAQRVVVVVINPPLQFTSVAPLSPPLPVLVPAAVVVEAAGGLAPYAFELAGGSLPPGLVLGRSGKIGGVPTTPGTFRFTLRVRDKLFQSATQDYELVVGDGTGSGGVLALDLAPNPAVIGQSVVMTATVASLSGTPTGVVDLWVAARGTRCPDPFESGEAPVTSITRTLPLSSGGAAHFVFTDLGAGTFRVCARYRGGADAPVAMAGPTELHVIKGVVLDADKAMDGAVAVPGPGPLALALAACMVALAGALRLRRRVTRSAGQQLPGAAQRR